LRLIRSLVLLVLCASVLAACSKPTQSRPGGRNSWTVPGVLRLGEQDEPDNLNPMFGHTASTDEVDGMIFSFLMRYDDNGNYIPDLVTTVPTLKNAGISQDGKTITLHLRKNAKWADGVPLTARDWMFTYHAVLNPRNNTKLLYGWDDIASAQTPDDYTIVIHLKHPMAAFLGTLAMGGSAYPPLPAHILAGLPDLNKAEFNSKPLSSGPYVLTAWYHGSSLEFAPNPYYFRGPPKLKKVIWKVVQDVNTLFNQLRTHDVDVYPAVDENSIGSLSQIEGVRVVPKLVANWRRLMFNTSRPALHDPRVRLAIAEAVDWKNINDTVYHGYNQLAVSDMFPQSWAAPAIPRYKYDVADAKRLLKAAGWVPGPNGVLQKNGQPLSLQISTGTNKQENQQAEVVIQGELKNIGVDVFVHNYPVSLLFAQDGPLYTGKYDMDWTIDTNGPDPDNAGNWAGKFIPPKGANTAWLDDPIVNQTALAAGLTYDQAKRKALYQKEEERIHVLVPAVFLYWEKSYTAMNTDVKNYKPAAFINDSWNSWEWDI
jgi:peptide/nickel transport system substrate-binding protein